LPILLAHRLRDQTERTLSPISHELLELVGTWQPAELPRRFGIAAQDGVCGDVAAPLEDAEVRCISLREREAEDVGLVSVAG